MSATLQRVPVPARRDPCLPEAALAAIESALIATDAILDALADARACAGEAAREESLGLRALLAERYDEIRARIDAVVLKPDAAGLVTPRGTGLLVSGGHLGRTVLALPRNDLSAAGLGLVPPAEGFEDQHEIAAITAAIERASRTVAAAANRWIDSAAFLSISSG